MGSESFIYRRRSYAIGGKVPGFSIVLNVLLTRKLPTFLSRSNEISGGCEKIAPVSGSFCSILKLLRMIAFTRLLWVYLGVKTCNVFSLFSTFVVLHDLALFCFSTFCFLCFTSLVILAGFYTEVEPLL